MPSSNKNVKTYLNTLPVFKMLTQKHTKTTTPEKAKAVDFFNHFPSNFFKPYALANDAPDPDTINR